MKRRKHMNDNINLVQAWSNDDKRKQFIEAYKDWGVYETVSKLDLAYYRYEMPDGTIIYAMEHNQKTYDYQNGTKEGWKTGVSYYIQKKGDRFMPSPSSIWAVADLMKQAKMEFQRECKNTQ